MIKLRDIPPDLDEYFMRIMESIDPFYQKEASALLQIALSDNFRRSHWSIHNHAFKSSNEAADEIQRAISLAIGQSGFRLLHVNHIDEGAHPGFCTSTGFATLNISDRPTMEEVLEDSQRRVMSRCMGLLEVVNRDDYDAWLNRRWSKEFIQPVNDFLLRPTIQFLHRTVKDFLLRPTSQTVLHNYTRGPYDAYTFQVHAFCVDLEIMSNYAFDMHSIQFRYALRAKRTAPLQTEASPGFEREAHGDRGLDDDTDYKKWRYVDFEKFVPICVPILRLVADPRKYRFGIKLIPTPAPSLDKDHVFQLGKPSQTLSLEDRE
jgi:hypothetical protein